MAVKGLSAILVVLGALAGAVADDTTTLAAIGPPKLKLSLTFNSGGVVSNDATPCTNQADNSTCLTPIAAGDTVTVTYATMSNYTTNTTATVGLKLCYASAVSTYDRTWRKPNAQITLDKQCGNAWIGAWLGSGHDGDDATGTVAVGLPPQGTYTWIVPEYISKATVFIRAYVQCPAPAGSTNMDANGNVFCAYGNSVGFFQLVPEFTPPDSLKHLVIGMCFVGPVLLALYFVVEKFVKKND